MRVLILLVMLVCVSSVNAKIIETGGYKFDFTVTNNWNKVFAEDFYSIKLNVTSNVAHVFVASSGYDTNEFDLDLNLTEPVIKHTVVMAEPTIGIKVINYNEETVKAEVVKLPQAVSYQDYYLKLLIDSAAYSQFEWWDLTVKNFGEELYSYKVEVEQTEDGRAIFVTIPRLLIFADEINDIEVVVPENSKLTGLRRSKTQGLKFKMLNQRNK